MALRRNQFQTAPSDGENPAPASLPLDTDVAGYCLSPKQSAHEALSALDRKAKGIVLVTDERQKLLGTITDGDIRRWVLSGHGLDAPLARLLDAKAKPPHVRPVTAPVGWGREEILGLMHEHTVQQVPLLHSDGRVAGLVCMSDLIADLALPLEAVIMAGGFGTRLRPLTDHVPKPMLPVGDRPLMELTVQQLRQAGIRRVNVTTHYMPEKIITHFGDGSRFGVEFRYVNEQSPLGTAGALKLLDEPSEPLLVMNGDILTGVDFRAMYKYHAKHGAALTVGVRKYDMHVPYGVVHMQGAKVERIVEKPTMSLFVNAGIYLLEPSMLRHIPSDRRFDMTDLIQSRLADGDPVYSFPILEYWLDIGKPVDYEQAQTDVRQGRFAA
jgi:dTDP-glucose pyrophosphorylase